MEQIESILRSNHGNRLTNELIVGLTAMIGHRVNEMFAEAVNCTRAQAEQELQNLADQQSKPNGPAKTVAKKSATASARRTR